MLLKYDKSRYGVIVALDIGSTWIKLGVADAMDGRLLCPLRTWRSPVPQLTGTGPSPQRFIHSAGEAAREISYLCHNAEVRAVGMSGVREGLAVTSPDGKLVWASGNSPHTDDPFSGPSPAGGSVTSLQGAVAGWLTREYAMCMSEATGLSLSMRLDAGRSRLSAHILKGHKPAGFVSATNVPVFLAGYDEQVAVFGCRLSDQGGLQLNAATFWGLLACRAENSMNTRAARFVAAIPPFPCYAAIVFPYWGEVAWRLLSGQLPGQPFSDAIKKGLPGLQADGNAAAADVLEHIKWRLADAIKLLSDKNSAYNRILVTGGGAAPRYRKMMAELLPEFLDVSYLDDDPTISGIVRLVQYLKFGQAASQTAESAAHRPSESGRTI